MANPADMTDEELQQVIATGIEPEEKPESQEEPEAPAEETPLEEEEKPAAEEEPEKPEEEPAEEEPKEEEPQPSRREQLRIQDLLKKYGPPQERSQAPSQKPDLLNYEEALDADPAVLEQLSKDRDANGQFQYNAGLEAAKTIQFETRLELDAPTVEAKYTFLNPRDKENFDPVRANAMNTLFLQQVGYDPGNPQKGIPSSVQNSSIRYRDFVEAQMEFAEALMADRQNTTVKNVARQAATTGLRPDGSAAKKFNLNKNPQDMSTEELYAAIGQTPPKK